MLKRITIICPSCSTALAAPVSAVGKSLLCPKCRMGIPVPTEDAAANRMRLWTNARRLGRRLAAGLVVLVTIGVMIWGVESIRLARRAKVIETTFRQHNFHMVLALAPDHVEALAGRARQQLAFPKTNVEGAVRDLMRLEQLAPEHPIHSEILPALSIAESLEHAKAGRTQAAIHDLKKATILGVASPQLLQVSQTLISVFLQQAEDHLGNSQYAEALADCDSALKLGGTPVQVAPIKVQAYDALAGRATTAEEIDFAIHGLEALQEDPLKSDLPETIRGLYWKRCQLAYSAGFHDAAMVYFLKSQSEVPRDEKGQQFAIDLARSATAAFAAEQTLEKRERALAMVTIHLKDFVDTEVVVAIRLRLATALVTDFDSPNPDVDIDFATRHLALARTSGIDLKPYQPLVDSLAQALANRCIRHLQQDNVPQGVEDFLAATALNRWQRLALLRRLQLAGVTIPDELQQDPAAANPDQIWSVIPAEAEAFSVVRNMEDLSEKVDQVAGIMNLEPLRLLDKASEESKILDGLARDGSLAWVKMPLGTGGRSGRTGFLYFVPTTDFETMIEPIMKGAFDALPLPTANLHPVEMNEWSGFAAELKQYGVFAFADDRKTVSAALASERSALGEVIPFDDWGTNVDGYFVLTDQGIRSGLRQFEIPFSTPSLESMLDLVRTSALVSRQFAAQDLPDLAKPLRQLAVGLELDPNRGVAVRSRLWLDPAIDLNESMSESPGGRERSLNLLPDARFLIAIGGPVSAKQCEMLSTQLGQSFPNQRKPEISLNAFQFALLAPDPIPADGEPRLPAKTLNAFERYYDCLILTATVPNAQTALKDIETWFAAFDQIAQQNDGVNPLERLVAIESRDLQGVPVLQITMAADAQQILPMLAGVRLNIAAANGETLVCTLGGDEQLTRALAPSRGAASMSESAAVRAAVRMLPESTSSIAVTDLSRVIQEVMYRGRQDHAQWLFEQLGLEPEVPFPVALGVSWRQSELDIQLSIPVETLPLLGRVPTFFPWLQFRFQ